MYVYDRGISIGEGTHLGWIYCQLFRYLVQFSFFLLSLFSLSLSHAF